MSCLIYFCLYRCNPSQLSDFKRAGQEQRRKFKVLGHVHRAQIHKVAETHRSHLTMISLVFRLTGLYAIVIGLHATLLKFFATGVQASTFGRLTNFDRINVAELSSTAAVRVLPKQLVDQLALRQQSPLDQRGGDGMCGARMVRHLVRNKNFVQPYNAQVHGKRHAVFLDITIYYLCSLEIEKPALDPKPGNRSSGIVDNHLYRDPNHFDRCQRLPFFSHAY